MSEHSNLRIGFARIRMRSIQTGRSKRPIVQLALRHSFESTCFLIVSSIQYVDRGKLALESSGWCAAPARLQFTCESRAIKHLDYLR